jgi:hypothetical protein
MEPTPRPSMRFYLHSALALILLFLITLMIEPSLELTPLLRALQGGILFGLALAAVKMLFRHYNISWPSRRH